MNKSKNIFDSFKYAASGIVTAFKEERNLKVHLTVMILVIILGFILKLSTFEWTTCLICFALVIGAEIFNTSIETLVDMVSPEISEGAKKCKDTSAGAVLIMAIFSSIIGLIIFLPKIIEILI
jgi:diacylglycerol kinase